MTSDQRSPDLADVARAIQEGAERMGAVLAEPFERIARSFTQLARPSPFPEALPGELCGRGEHHGRLTLGESCGGCGAAVTPSPYLDDEEDA